MRIIDVRKRGKDQRCIKLYIESVRVAHIKRTMADMSKGYNLSGRLAMRSFLPEQMMAEVLRIERVERVML